MKILAILDIHVSIYARTDRQTDIWNNEAHFIYSDIREIEWNII